MSLYHVSRCKNLPAGFDLLPSVVRYERMSDAGNAAGCLMLVARMTSRWGDAPLWGARSLGDVRIGTIEALMGHANGRYVWMTETLAEARELAEITGGTVYEVEADDVEYRMEDNRDDDAATIYPVAKSATVVARV